jgi:hypothetical protein
VDGLRVVHFHEEPTMAKKSPADRTPVTELPTQEVLLGSNIHPSVITIDGTDRQLGEFVAAAQAASGLSIEDWNGLDGEDLDRRIDAAIVAAGGLSILSDVKEPPSPSAPAEMVECAVLHDSIYGKHDDIIELPLEQAEAARSHGYVDTHPNAIKAIRENV